jgi:hypothetical protein
MFKCAGQHYFGEEIMEDHELKEAILQFIKKRCERHKKIPSLRIMFKHFKKLSSTGSLPRAYPEPARSQLYRS